MKTRIRLSDGSLVSVFAFYTDNYLKLCTEDGTKVGYVTFEIKPEGKDFFGHTEPPHVYIIHMQAIGSLGSHIGTALHEFIFRLSMERQCEGRVKLNAVRNSHLFHVKNGFRLEYGLIEATHYYLRIAKEFIAANGSRLTKDLGSHNLYLPLAQIKKKQIQFGITEISSDEVSQFPEEPSEEEKVDYAHEILQEAQECPLVTQILSGLQTPFGPKRPQLSLKGGLIHYKKSMEKYKTVNAPEIRLFLDTALLTIVKNLPIDTEEKASNLAITLAGTMILTILYYKKLSKEQEWLFNHPLLSSQINVDDLIEDEKITIDELIEQLGEKALIDKSIPFDGKISPEVFPDLATISELETIFTSYLMESTPNLVILKSRIPVENKIFDFQEEENTTAVISITEEKDTCTAEKGAPAEEKSTLSDSYNSLSEQIDSILNSFAKKIDLIGKHHFEAKQKASDLLGNLRALKNSAFTDPDITKLEQFKDDVKLKISDATPFLQRDLGWGDYLSNLVHQLINTVTIFIAQAATFGASKHHGFFTVKQSDANHAAQEINQNIDEVFSKKLQ